MAMASSTFLGFNPLSFGNPRAADGQQQQQQAGSPPRIGGGGAAAHQQPRGAPEGPAAAALVVPSGDAEVQRITEQYNSEAARLAEQLSLCGIQQQGLSEQAQADLQLLAQLASALQLTQAKPQLILAAWALLLVQESKATTLQHTLQRELSALGQMRARARQKLALLQRVLADVQARQAREAARAHDKAKLTEQMQQKDKGYAAMIAKQSKRLEQSGFTPEVTHAALLAQHAQLQKLQAQLCDLRAQLDGYHALPATLLGARMKLQEARRQLEEKHARFQSQLADTH